MSFAIAEQRIIFLCTHHEGIWGSGGLAPIIPILAVDDQRDQLHPSRNELTKAIE
jgi:hypothetical protein